MTPRKVVPVAVLFVLVFATAAFADTVGWTDNGLGGSAHKKSPERARENRPTVPYKATPPTTTVQRIPFDYTTRLGSCTKNPDGFGYEVVTHYADGSTSAAVDCTISAPSATPAPQSAKPVPTALDVWNVGSSQVYVPAVTSDPKSQTLVRLATNFTCDKAPQPVSFTLPAFGVSAEAHPVSYEWTVTDSAGVASTTLSKTCSTSYTFDHSGNYTISLATRWAASYSDGSGTHELATKLFTSAVYPMAVAEARGMLG